MTTAAAFLAVDPGLAAGAPHPRAHRRDAVRIDNLSYAARDRRGGEVPILDAVSLSVAEGEFVALVGPSGCGKTTLLNIVAGLVPASGLPVDVRDDRVGYMFQTDALFPWRSVLDNVTLGLELRGVARAEREARGREILASLGLTAWESHYPTELSGGMRQRVSLARMWITDPSLVLMDEPFGALDAQMRLVVQDLFLSYWEAHRKTVVLVTHDIEEAITMADRVVVFGRRPARVKSIHTITLPRPRRAAELRGEADFSRHWQSIWTDLRDDLADDGSSP